VTSATQAPAQRSRATLSITIGVVIALVIAFFIFANLYTEVLWYDQLGFVEVLTTQWIAGIVMFLIGFLGMAFPVWLSIQLAYRSRPIYAKLNAQLDRYQQVIEPLRKFAMWAIPIVLGLFAGVSTASRWPVVLLWLNRTSTGATDPQFGLDNSFYLFELPFYQGLVGFASAVVLISGIAALATAYLYGAFRVVGRHVQVARAARIQLALTAAVYVALQGVSIWLDQYATLVSSSSGLLVGASYADDNAAIPGRAILAGIAFLVAILFVVTAFTGGWRLPLIGTGLLIVSAIVLGTIYPWIIQRLQVEPSAKSLEAPYVQRNIDGTRAAYDLTGVSQVPYAAATDTAAGALREDAETTANIRIIDPALVSPSLAQVEQYKQYYQFAPHLDVDRYTLDGESQDTVIAVRELNQDDLGGAANWYNNTLVYTHGYGVVAAYGNQRTDDGQVKFIESGIPIKGQLGEYEPRIYFGEYSPGYSIVGAAQGGKEIELDYPSSSDEDDSNAATTTFDGDGGPKLDSVFDRVAYALKFQSEQILLSDAVGNDSQILYDRDPAERVQKVAPYLTLDSDPYPAVVDGKVVWIIDGYTTSANYPYSDIASLKESIADTYTAAPVYAVDNINYIRNSVKATVDAYDGSVTLYAWDTEDPMLKTWQKIFPSTLTPMSEMTADLISHVRYPADLFKMQRTILGNYHVTNAESFFSNEDAWVTPNDPTKSSTDTALQPPYFMTMKMPDDDEPAFSLYSTFIPAQQGDQARNVMMGYFAVNSDAGSTAGEVADSYGKLTLLTLPKDDTVPGPGQMQNIFNTNTVVANELNLLEQGGQTKVLRGNLLSLPVGGGLLYVQPVYVQSTGDTSFPLLRKVLVGFGTKIAFEDTLDQALDVLFGGDSGADAGDGGTTPVDPSDPGTDPETDPGTDPETDPGTGGDNAALTTALADAQEALAARETALASGDWEAYGVADAALQDAIERAIAASE
jgi:uncharacterized membrane protein (UPF0182 family)